MSQSSLGSQRGLSGTTQVPSPMLTGWRWDFTPSSKRHSAPPSAKASGVSQAGQSLTALRGHRCMRGGRPAGRPRRRSSGRGTRAWEWSVGDGATGLRQMLGLGRCWRARRRWLLLPPLPVLRSQRVPRGGASSCRAACQPRYRRSSRRARPITEEAKRRGEATCGERAGTSAAGRAGPDLLPMSPLTSCLHYSPLADRSGSAAESWWRLRAPN